MRRTYYLSILAGFLFLLFVSFTTESNEVPQIPEEVSVILAASCYHCHSAGSKNKDALKKLNLEKWDEYKLMKKISLSGDICEMIEKNKMPPAKYLGINPDKELTEKQKKILCEWTEKESARLMNGE